MIAPIAPTLWPILLGLIVGTVVLVFLALHSATRSNGDRARQSFAVLLGSVAVWLAGQAAVLASNSLGAMTFWHQVTYVGVVVTPVSWIAFALSYTGRDHLVDSRGIGIAAAFVATVLALSFTNGSHQLFYSGRSIDFVGLTPVLNLDPASLWWAYFGISYLLVGVGIVLLVSFAVSTEATYRGQVVALFAACLFPLAANVVTIFGVPIDPPIDLTPLSFGVGAVFLFVAVYYGRFLELIPVDTDTIIKNLGDAVIVVNEDDQVVNANPKAAAVFADGTVDSIIGEDLESVEPTLAIPDRGRVGIDAGSFDEGFEVSRVSGGELQWFWVRTESLGATTTKRGSVFTLTDVSKKKRFERRLRELLRTNQRLVTADTPEQVVSVGVDAAKDVLGHPITGIWRYDEDTNRLDPVCMTREGTELIDEQPAFEPGESLAWEAFEAGELRSYEDLTERPERYNEQTPIRSEIHVPIGEWGLLTTGSTEPGDFLDIDQYLLQLLGEGIQSALRKTRREQRIRKLQERTSSLIEASSEEIIAREAVETADEVLGLPLTGLYLLEEDGQVLAPAAVTEAVKEQFESPPTYPSGVDDGSAAVVWDVFERGVPLVTGGVGDADQRLANRAVESAIVYPLGDHGVLVSSSPEPDAFEPIDQALAELLATAVTAALERGEREAELRERERELRRQNERLEQFTSAVSHDLRSPLNRADLYLDILAERYDDSELEAVVKANERAQGMIENLLRLARQGKTVENPETEPVSETVSMAWESVRTRSTSLSVTDGIGTVDADHARLREAFENLFRNAVEHGGESVRVGRLDDDAGLFVADDGSGIPADDRNEVFEHGYSTAEDGTGFGLAIVERIIEAHGWRIDVTESRDGGARFEIESMSSLSTPARPADD